MRCVCGAAGRGKRALLTDARRTSVMQMTVTCAHSFASTMYIYICASSDLMPSMWGVSVIKEQADGVTGNGVQLNEMEEVHTLWT